MRMRFRFTHMRMRFGEDSYENEIWWRQIWEWDLMETDMRMRFGGDWYWEWDLLETKMNQLSSYENHNGLISHNLVCMSDIKVCMSLNAHSDH